MGGIQNTLEMTGILKIKVTRTTQTWKTFCVVCIPPLALSFYPLEFIFILCLEGNFIALEMLAELVLYLNRKNRDRRSSESPGGNHQDTDRPGRSEPPPDPAGLGTAGIGGKHPALSPHSLRL